MGMKPMLAGQFVANKIEGQLPIYGQPKLDGIRMFVRDGVAYTRSLKPVRSEQVQAIVAEHADILEGLDGEIIAGDPTAEDAYRRTCSAVMSYGKFDDTKFHVFDLWNSKHPFKIRLLELGERYEIGGLPPWVQGVETILLDTMEDIIEFEEQKLRQGYEGVILRSPEGVYKFGRGTPTKGELIKLKKFLDTEATVVGFHEFMHNANDLTTNELGYAERSSHQDGLVPMGTLGALEAEGEFPDGTKYTVRIGTGFDTETRQEIWDRRDEFMGRLVKFKYFGGGVKEAPRFPVFLGWRDKADTTPAPKEASAPTQGELF